MKFYYVLLVGIEETIRSWQWHTANRESHILYSMRHNIYHSTIKIIIIILQWRNRIFAQVSILYNLYTNLWLQFMYKCIKLLYSNNVVHYFSLLGVCCVLCTHNVRKIISVVDVWSNADTCMYIFVLVVDECSHANAYTSI